MSRDVRFAPLLIGPLIACGKVLSKSEFEADVFRKIAPLADNATIPQILVAFLQNIDTLFASVENVSLVYPLIYASLASQHPPILKEVLAKLSTLMPRFPAEVVEARILPALMKVMLRQANDFTPEALTCVVKALDASDHARFATNSLPKVAEVFRATKDPAIIPPVCDMLMKIKADDLTLMRHAVPLASELCTNVACDPYWQKQLCGWMLGFVTRWKTSNNLDGIEDPKPKPPDATPSEAAAMFDPLGEFGDFK